jgi:CysZ protein
VAQPVREFLAGVSLLSRGLALIARRPRLFALGAIPPLITSLVFTAVLVVVFLELDRLSRWLTPFADEWAPEAAGVARTLAGIALLGGLVLIMVISFTALTLAVGAPLYDRLSESVEREFGEVPELIEPARTGVVRGLRQSAALIATSAFGAIVLFACGFLPVIGQTVVPVASATFGGWMLATELIGSTFERRGLVRLADRRAALRRRRMHALGLAVPTFLLLAIPFAGILVFPIATAAGTLLARELLGEPIVPTRPHG